MAQVDIKEIDGYVLQSAVRESGFSELALEQAYAKLNGLGSRTLHMDKLLAEISYLLATKVKDTNPDRARGLANESIGLYIGLNIQTSEEAVPIFGEALPDYMHEGVVRRSLKDLIDG